MHQLFLLLCWDQNGPTATFSITLPATPALLMATEPESCTSTGVRHRHQEEQATGTHFPDGALPVLGAPLLKRTPETERNMKRGGKEMEK